MSELQSVQAAIEAVLKLLEAQGYSRNTVKVQRGILNGLVKYMKTNGLTELDEEICMNYIRSRSGTNMQGLFGVGDKRTNAFMKPIQNLLDFMENGQKKSVFTAQHLINRFNHRIFQSFFIQFLGRTIRSFFFKAGDTPPDYGSTPSVVPMHPSIDFTAFTAINDTGQSIFTAVTRFLPPLFPRRFTRRTISSCTII